MRTSRAGFTLLELLIALGLLGLVITNVFMVLGDSSKALGSKNSSFAADAQARRTLDRIAMSVIGASRDSLVVAVEPPAFRTELYYQTSLGWQGGEMVASNPQKVAMVGENPREVVWCENPGQPDEKRIVWSKWVGEYMEGEFPNGEDDNDNGLIDERGLCFVVEGNRVIIRLTIEKPGPDGKLYRRKLETTVTCRN
jgi:prepilin-type N-terminal cleavage/methylation domain-containing protein